MDISLREWLGDCAGPGGGEDWFAQTDIKINQLLDKIAKLEALVNRPQQMLPSFMVSMYMAGHRHGGGGATDNMYAPKIVSETTDDNSFSYIVASGGNGISNSIYIPINCTLRRIVTAHGGTYNAAISKPPFLTVKRGTYSMPGINSYAQANEVARITNQYTNLNIPFNRGQIFWLHSYVKTPNDGVTGDYIPLGGWTTCFFVATEGV